MVGYLEPIYNKGDEGEKRESRVVDWGFSRLNLSLMMWFEARTRFE